MRGRILEIHDSQDGGSVMRIATRGSYDNPLWVESPVRPSPTIVERSSVTVFGYLAGSYSYRSQAGWDITIPQALAVGVLTQSEASSAARAAQRAREQP